MQKLSQQYVMPTPTLHKSVPLGSRVVLSPSLSLTIASNVFDEIKVEASGEVER